MENVISISVPKLKEDFISQGGQAFRFPSNVNQYIGHIKSVGESMGVKVEKISWYESRLFKVECDEILANEFLESIPSMREWLG